MTLFLKISSRSNIINKVVDFQGEVMGEREIKFVEIAEGDGFTICPNCGYKDGFHSVFENFKSDGKADWYLICPKCSAKYDIGLEYKR